YLYLRSHGASGSSGQQQPGTGHGGRGVAVVGAPTGLSLEQFLLILGDLQRRPHQGQHGGPHHHPKRPPPRAPKPGGPNRRPRRHLRPAVRDTLPLTEEQLTVVEPGPQHEPHRVRPVTYTTPEGPTFVGTEPTAPYGEDPGDPTTHAEPRRGSAGMVGRLHQ